jgi:ribulose bisphosphate carboxylase small subunit
MKTQIRTLITVSALVLSGVLNANSAVNFEERNSRLISANESLTVLNEKIASFENELNGSIDYGKEALLVTKWIADMAEAKANQKVMELGFVAPSETINSFENEVVNENMIETTDFGKEALSITILMADIAEAKAAQRVIERGYVAPSQTTDSFENEVVNENNNETTDFGKEALSITKSIADKEEAKAIERVLERGFVAPVETTNSFENEVGYENKIEMTDFGKEALSITKSIADKEEAKAIQKVMDRGFIAPVETSSSIENEVGYENNFEMTDFGKEALLITKSIADREEAKVIQKIMERGFIAPVETTDSFENETTDFGKEALLITKLIADKAEADTIQKLVAEGKLIANE